MPLVETLSSIAKNLNESRYPNEQAISQGVVLRILTDLGWDQWNTDHVWPEFTLGIRRVDFALCFPSRKPVAFIEVKQPGKVDGADQQLFEYAFHEGVPMAILCDGRTWSFYLPGEQGSYEERRVYKLDLVERPAAEAAAKLHTYLSHARIVSGEAIEQARRDYRDQNRRFISRQTLPEAWRALVEDEDPTVVERLASEVEAKCGVRPEFDDVTWFLSKLRAESVTSLVQPKVVASLSAATPVAKSSESSRSQMNMLGPIGFSLRGTWQNCHSAKDVMLTLLQKLAQQDADFCPRCYRDEANRGRSRIYISPNKYELYQKTPDFAEDHSAEFTPGWYVATNLSNQAKDNVIRMAIRVAKLSLGFDVDYRLA